MDYLQQVPLTLNHVNAGCAAGTTTTLTTTANTVCSIAGKFATALASGNNQAIPAVDVVTGVAPVTLVSTAAAGGQAAAIVFGINNAGAIKICQGPATPTELGVTTTAGAFILAPQFPTIPDDFCPIAYTVVRTSPTGASFTAGTTSWTASGITTATFRNISTLPARPQIS